jgi:hypothetical protein
MIETIVKRSKIEDEEKKEQVLLGSDFHHL